MLEHIKISYNDGYQPILPNGFNWFAVLKDLTAGADYSLSDKIKLMRLAGNWTSCACGQLCTNLPRKYGIPYDHRLRSLGASFYFRIQTCEWAEATDVLHQIEARNRELLGIEE